MFGLFSPDEAAVLAGWFGVTVPDPIKAAMPTRRAWLARFYDLAALTRDAREDAIFDYCGVPVYSLTDAELAAWLDGSVDPDRIGAEVAAAHLGFEEELNGGLYTALDAAVAAVVLSDIEDRLPTCGAWSDETGLVLGRTYRTARQKPERQLVLRPRRLFEITWAFTAPGLSWPVDYKIAWVPVFDRHVVTVSADSWEAFGYSDFALGAIGPEDDLLDGVREIIVGEWRAQRGEHDQQRWAAFDGGDLVDEATAEAWADAAWREGEDEDL